MTGIGRWLQFALTFLAAKPRPILLPGRTPTFSRHNGSTRCIAQSPRSLHSMKGPFYHMPLSFFLDRLLRLSLTQHLMAINSGMSRLKRTGLLWGDAGRNPPLGDFAPVPLDFDDDFEASDNPDDNPKFVGS
ncbi:hypothetical protein FRC08_014058 [Ceratobasidium sp. 394]|nr:hypothetical protein FRC08_014058 [Ceratobasidium sp. 394]KAG9095690.1 hypothetical protein FS749_009998 [Ceratobasidium sp. UAMH 11750]